MGINGVEPPATPAPLAVDVRLAELDRLLLGDGGGPQALGQGMVAPHRARLSCCVEAVLDVLLVFNDECRGVRCLLPPQGEDSLRVYRAW